MTFPKVVVRIFVAVLLAQGALWALSVDETGQRDQKEQIERLESQMAAALVSNDSRAYGECLARDWKMVNTDGSILDKGQVLDLLSRGDLHFDSYRVERLEIRIYGEAAVVIGVDRATGQMNGEAYTGHDRFTDVFAEIDGEWKVVSTHVSALGER